MAVGILHQFANAPYITMRLTVPCALHYNAPYITMLLTLQCALHYNVPYITMRQTEADVLTKYYPQAALIDKIKRGFLLSFKALHS